MIEFNNQSSKHNLYLTLTVKILIIHTIKL